MHDPTEGGLATALYEMAEASGLGVAVREEAITVLPETQAICSAASLAALGLLASGALLIAVFDPVALAVLRSPGECGADIAVGEGQALGAGMSFTEFSYQTLQAADFLHLHQHEGVDMQMGGADQWGNITAGIDLAVLPIGDNFTMGPDDALRAVGLLNPRLVVPMHYGTWPLVEQDPHAFAQRVEEMGIRCSVLSPGQKLTL
jgi:hypothetical protein